MSDVFNTTAHEFKRRIEALLDPTFHDRPAAAGAFVSIYTRGVHWAQEGDTVTVEPVSRAYRSDTQRRYAAIVEARHRRGVSGPDFKVDGPFDD